MNIEDRLKWVQKHGTNLYLNSPGIMEDIADAIAEIKRLKKYAKNEYCTKRREFEKFLFNETDLGALECVGSLHTHEIAEQILPFFEVTK